MDSLSEQNKRGAALLQALVQEGALPELRHAFRTRDPRGTGLLARSNLPPPTARWSSRDLDDLLSLVATDRIGRVRYPELLSLGASMLNVETMKQELQLSHGVAASWGTGQRTAVSRWVDPVDAQQRSDSSASADGGPDTWSQQAVVDYRRYDALGEAGQPALRDYRHSSWFPAEKDGEPEEEDEEQDEEDEYEFPAWWFAVIASIQIPNQLFSTSLWSIVWPVAIANMFGYGNKAVALSMADTVNVFVGFANPFVGSLSDRLPERYAARFGRRRPFVFIGTVTSGVGVWLTYVALYQRPNVWILLASLIIGNVSSTLAMVPFGAIAVETISPKQRGISIAISSWVGGVCTLGGWGIGIYVGEHAAELTAVLWWINILKFGVQLPLLMIACGGRAGCCTRERKRTPTTREKRLVKAREEMRATGDYRLGSGGRVHVDSDGFFWNESRTARWDRQNGLWVKDSPPGWSARVMSSLRDFSSAFREPAFKWMWIYTFIQTIGGTFSNYFFIYWMQDTFNEGFYVMGYKVASNVQSAVAVNGAVASIVGVCVSWSGSWWRDRFGGRQVCMFTSAVGLLMPFTYAYAPHFIGEKDMYTLVFGWCVANALLGGIAGVSGQALQMDCLPTGADGRPLEPARDFGLMGWSGRISMLFLPIAIGQSLKLFKNHADGYAAFYLIGGTISALAFLIFAFLVHPLDEPLGLSMQCTRGIFHAEYDSLRRSVGDDAARAAYVSQREDALEAEAVRLIQGQASGLQGGAVAARRPPIGALCCDRLLFGAKQARGAGDDDGDGGSRSQGSEPQKGGPAAATGIREMLLPGQAQGGRIIQRASRA